MPAQKMLYCKIEKDLCHLADPGIRVSELPNARAWCSLSAYVGLLMRQMGEAAEVVAAAKADPDFPTDPRRSDDVLLERLGGRIAAVAEAGSGDPDVRAFLAEANPDPLWRHAAALLALSSYTDDELREYALDSMGSEPGTVAERGQTGTPAYVRQIALRVLKPQNGERVADIGCGAGNFLLDAAAACPGAELVGYELDPVLACLARVRLGLAGASAHIVEGDAFETLPRGEFDKALVHAPLGARAAEGSTARRELAALVGEDEARASQLGSDWAFVKLAEDALTDGGTAVAVVAAASLSKVSETAPRRRLVEEGRLRAVLKLPRGISKQVEVPAALLVLGSNPHEVRMADASDLYERGRRRNGMGPEQVKKAVTRLHLSSPASTQVGPEYLLASSTCNLDPRRFLATGPGPVKGARLGDLAEEIVRGVSISAGTLDDHTTDERTGLRYLRLTDIVDGTLAETMPNLDTLDFARTLHEACDGDLVISKSGKPFKVAVAQVRPDERIVVSDNVFVVRLKTGWVDPWYLAAFLSSAEGLAELHKASGGASIPSLSKQGLAGVDVPVPAPHEQLQVADRYQRALRAAARAQRELETAREAMSLAYGARTRA